VGKGGNWRAHADALRHKRSNGERVANIRFGYRLYADGKHVEHEPGEQAVIAAINHMRATGTSLRRIARNLNERGWRRDEVPIGGSNRSHGCWRQNGSLAPPDLYDESVQIGLLSDTHGFLDVAIFTYFDQCDEVLLFTLSTCKTGRKQGAILLYSIT
jgi:hypothetical protein